MFVVEYEDLKNPQSPSTYGDYGFFKSSFKKAFKVVRKVSPVASIGIAAATGGLTAGFVAKQAGMFAAKKAYRRIHRKHHHSFKSRRRTHIIRRPPTIHHIHHSVKRPVVHHIHHSVKKPVVHPYKKPVIIPKRIDTFMVTYDASEKSFICKPVDTSTILRTALMGPTIVIGRENCQKLVSNFVKKLPNIIDKVALVRKRGHKYYCATVRDILQSEDQPLIGQLITGKAQIFSSPSACLKLHPNAEVIGSAARLLQPQPEPIRITEILPATKLQPEITRASIMEKKPKIVTIQPKSQPQPQLRPQLQYQPQQSNFLKYALIGSAGLLAIIMLTNHES